MVPAVAPAMAPAMTVAPSFNSVAPPYLSLDSRPQAGQGQLTPMDDAASISVGSGASLNSGYSMPALSRGPRFTVGIGFESTAGTANPRLSAELQSQLANSPSFPGGKNVTVTVENNVVILRGKVADEHERDLAEAVVRLSPGVYNVQNELMVGDATASNK
jgi:hypothetical protein